MRQLEVNEVDFILSTSLQYVTGSYLVAKSSDTCLGFLCFYKYDFLSYCDMQASSVKYYRQLSRVKDITLLSSTLRTLVATIQQTHILTFKSCLFLAVFSKIPSSFEILILSP